MKTKAILYSLSTILVLSLVSCGSNGGYQGVRTPLQPGDTVIFTASPTRAQLFRDASGNDPTNTGTAVIITKPTTIISD